MVILRFPSFCPIGGNAKLRGGQARSLQIGSGLVGVMYILDEPSIGLHQRDNDKLLDTLKNLRDLGNTVIVVEHDEDTILNSDCVVDIGPGAGEAGGEVVYVGGPSGIKKVKNSFTGMYLSRKKQIKIPKKRKEIRSDAIMKVHKASTNNLKNIDVEIPLGLMTCITGVSGSGKSTLIRCINRLCLLYTSPSPRDLSTARMPSSA